VKIRHKTARRQGGKGRPFVKGDPRSNLKGRPPLTLEQREFNELCKQKAPDALNRIEKNYAKATGMVGFLANSYIVDRGYGRPKQATEVSGPDGGAIEVDHRRLNPKDLSDEQIDKLDALLAGVNPPKPGGTEG
jgi:hypothetical protein